MNASELSPEELARRKRINKRLLPVVGAILVVLFAMVACLPDDTSKDAEEPTGKASKEPAETSLMVRTVAIEPAKTAAYLRGVEIRMPQGTVPAKRMVQYGQLACQHTDGYVTGSTPTPGDIMLPDVTADGYGQDMAEDIITTARNASRNTLCRHKIVEAK